MTALLKRAGAAVACFVGHLMNADDGTADSINFGGLSAIYGALLIEGYDVVVNGREAALAAFLGGVAAVLGAMGGGKRLRDGPANQQPPKGEA